MKKKSKFTELLTQTLAFFITVLGFSACNLSNEKKMVSMYGSPISEFNLNEKRSY